MDVLVMRLADWSDLDQPRKEPPMPRSVLRIIFAVVAVLAGIYMLLEANGDHVTIAGGLGLIAAGVGLVV